MTPSPDAERQRLGPEPHPWYGPCDGMGPDGECSECAKARFATYEEWLHWLQTDLRKAERQRRPPGRHACADCR